MINHGVCYSDTWGGGGVGNFILGLTTYTNCRKNKFVLFISVEVVTMYELNGVPAKWAPQTTILIADTHTNILYFTQSHYDYLL
jgi:hypothetical protein